MPRKGLLLIIIFLFLLFPVIVHANAVIYDEFVNVDETAKTSIGEFSVRYYAKADRQDTMVLEKKDESDFRLLIDDGECEYDQQYKFCFQGSQLGKHDYERDIDIMAVKLHIEELVPSLERTITKKSLVPGEETEATVKINIPEGRRAYVKYSETFPSELRIDSGKGVVQGNTLIFEGKVDGEFTLTYTLKLMAQDMEPFTAKGSLNYDFEGKTGKLTTDEITLTKLNDMEIGIEFDPEEAELGEEVELGIILDKKVDSSLDIKRLEIVFPKGTQYVQTDTDFEQDGDTYYWIPTKLTADKEYTYKIIQNSAENYSVKVVAKTDRDGNEQYQEKTAVLKSAIKDLDLGLTFPSTITYPKNIKLKAYFENKNMNTKFEDIKCSITGDLFNKEDYSFANSFPGKRTNIADEYVKLLDTSPRKLKHTFACTYRLPTGGIRAVQITKESQVNVTEAEVDGDQVSGGEDLEEGIDRKVGFTDIEEEPENVTKAQADEEEKVGFFKKIINWFKNLFSGDDAKELDEEEIKE